MKTLKYTSVQELATLSESTSTSKLDKLQFVSTCKATKKLLDKAVDFHNEGDDETAYVFLLRIVNLYGALKASLEAVKPLSSKAAEAWKSCGSALMQALDLAEVLKPNLVERYKEAEEHRAKLAALEQRLIEEKAATAAEDTASKSDITKGLSLDDTDTAVGVESGGDGDNGISPVDSVRTEPTQGEATNGHGDATRVVPGEQGLPNRSNGHLLVPVDVSGAVDDDIGGSSAKGYGGSVVIDPKELYTMITNDVGFLLIDLRPAEEYMNSHVDYANRIHVSTDILKSGMIVQNIEDKIQKKAYRRRLQKRDEYEYVVLVGGNVSAAGDPSTFPEEYQIVIDAMTKYEGHKRLKRAVRCVDGGFQNFYDYYPSHCTGRPLKPEKKRLKLSALSSLGPVAAYPTAPRINPDIDLADADDDNVTVPAETQPRVGTVAARRGPPLTTKTSTPPPLQRPVGDAQQRPVQQCPVGDAHVNQAPTQRHVDAQGLRTYAQPVADDARNPHRSRDGSNQHDAHYHEPQQPLVDIGDERGDHPHTVIKSSVGGHPDRYSQLQAPGTTPSSFGPSGSTPTNNTPIDSERGNPSSNFPTTFPASNVSPASTFRTSPSTNISPSASSFQSNNAPSNTYTANSFSPPVDRLPTDTMQPTAIPTRHERPPQPASSSPPDVRTSTVLPPPAQEYTKLVDFSGGDYPRPQQQYQPNAMHLPQRIAADLVNHKAIAADTPTHGRGVQPTREPPPRAGPAQHPRGVEGGGYQPSGAVVHRAGPSTVAVDASRAAQPSSVGTRDAREVPDTIVNPGSQRVTVQSVLPTLHPSHTSAAEDTQSQVIPTAHGNQHTGVTTVHRSTQPNGGISDREAPWGTATQPALPSHQSSSGGPASQPRSSSGGPASQHPAGPSVTMAARTHSLSKPMRAPPVPRNTNFGSGQHGTADTNARTSAYAQPRRTVLGDVSARVGNELTRAPSAPTQPPHKPQSTPSVVPRSAGIPAFDRSSKPESTGRLSQTFRAARMSSLEPANGSIGRALVGLRNLGNTCFMNSILQCLVAAAPLAKYFVQGRYRNDINRKNALGFKGEVAEEFGELTTIMWTRPYRYVHPRFFKSVISEANAQFAGYKQQDSQEFLAFLLDALHEDLNRVKSRAYVEAPDNTGVPDDVAAARAWDLHRRRNQSIIVDNFQGQFKSTLTCRTCGTTSVTFEPFAFLSLPISRRGSITLQECIQEFSRSEIVTGSDRWHCSKCKVPRDTTKSICIWKLPKILIVHLKRFYFEGPFRSKIDTLVKFPMTNLNMADYCKGKTSGNCKYNLFAVSNHFGNLEGGHYTAYCKNVFDHKWYDFNDSTVTRTNGPICTKESYVLLYSSLDFDDYNDLFG